MDFFINNYFQSQSFKELNKNIFKYETIDFLESNFFILRNKNNFKKKKIGFSKIELGTEFKGILEFFGQPVNFNFKNYEKELINFLDQSCKIIKEYNPGIVIFRSVDIETKEQFEAISKSFIKFGYSLRPWKSLIIDINNSNKDLLISNYNTRREIKLIKNLNVKIDEVKNFDEYYSFISFFFKTTGHENYPNKNKYFNLETWNNLNINHKFFIISMDDLPHSLFAVRIYKERAYWCMAGRIRNFKYSLHAYAIDFLFEYLKKKNIGFLDLAGFNPEPKNQKEKGIKYFKEKFEGKTIYQSSFILDNTIFVKNLRSMTNFFRKKRSFADEPII